MLIYGKEMLFNDRLYDIDERFEKLQDIEKSAVEEAIAETFGNEMAKKAVAVIANTDKPLTL